MRRFFCILVCILGLLLASNAYAGPSVSGGGSGGVSSGDMTKAVYDSNDDGIIAQAQGGAGADTSGMTGRPYLTSGVASIKPDCKSVAFNEPTASDDQPIHYTKYAITVTSIEGICMSGSVIGTFYYTDNDGTSNPTDIEADITFNGGTDTDTAGIDSAAVAAGKWIHWRTTSVTDPTHFTAQICFQ